MLMATLLGQPRSFNARLERPRMHMGPEGRRCWGGNGWHLLDGGWIGLDVGKAKAVPL